MLYKVEQVQNPSISGFIECDWRFEAVQNIIKDRLGNNWRVIELFSYSSPNKFIESIKREY